MIVNSVNIPKREATAVVTLTTKEVRLIRLAISELAYASLDRVDATRLEANSLLGSFIDLQHQVM